MYIVEYIMIVLIAHFMAHLLTHYALRIRSLEPYFHYYYKRIEYVYIATYISYCGNDLIIICLL